MSSDYSLTAAPRRRIRTRNHPLGGPFQFQLFAEVIECATVRDRVTDDGVFLNPPPGPGWRVLDARRERKTVWVRRVPVMRR